MNMHFLNLSSKFESQFNSHIHQNKKWRISYFNVLIFDANSTP